MTFADFLCANWPLLVACLLIPALPLLAFVLCRADRHHQVKRMHRMRRS